MTVIVVLLLLVPQVFFWGSQSPFLLTKATYVYLVGSFGCLILALAWRRRLSRAGPAAPAAPPAGFPRALLAAAAFVGYAALRGPWLAEVRPEIAAPFLWGAFLLVAWPMAGAIGMIPGTASRVERLLVALGGLTAGYAVLQAFGADLPFYRPHGRVLSATFHIGPGGPPFATLGNPNFLGEYLAALLPLALAGALARRGIDRWMMGGAAVLMAMALALTSARGAWLGAAAGLGMTALLRRGSPAERGRLIGLVLTVMVLSAVAGAVLQRFTEVSGPWDKLVSTMGQMRSSGEGRRLWWGATALMVADHPVLGIGEGRFREAYPGYQAAYLASWPQRDRASVWPAPVEAPHSDYLQVAAELGIPGLVLWLAVLGLIVTDGARGARRAGGIERASRAGSLGGLVALLVAGIVGHPIHTTSGLFLAAALSALAVTSLPGGEKPRPAPRWHWVLLIAVTAFGFGQAAHLLRVFAASLHLHRGTEALLRRDLPGAMTALERAHEVCPRDSQVRLALGEADLAAGRPDLALPYLEAGLRGFDASPLRAALGRAYLAVGQEAAAEETFRIGVASFPGYAPLHLAYGAFLVGRGRDAEASRELSRALDRDPKLANAHYLLGIVRSRQGDASGADEALRRFLALARPGDPGTEAAATLLRELGGPRPAVDNRGKPVK
jgi:O-antigen ligase/Tfp pilus assembly protein PilF